MGNEERATYEAALARIRDAECEICDVVSKRIHHETPNFNRLATGRQYDNDPYLELADTQYSFEELDEAMDYLSHVLEFRDEAMELSRLAKLELARPVEEREAVKILSAIEQLEPRLKEKTRGMKLKEGNAVHF